MAVTFKRLTKFHPYEPSKCGSFVVGDYSWDSISYCSVRHHPCFFLFSVLCPFCAIYKQRKMLLLNDMENFVCCVKCPRWQRYEGACCSPLCSPCWNCLEIVLCPVCATENNRHTVRKYYNISEEPLLSCIRMEYNCSRHHIFRGLRPDEEDGSADDSGLVISEAKAAEEQERADRCSSLGGLMLVVVDNPGACMCGFVGFLACFGCRALHIPFMLTQQHHELTELHFPAYRKRNEMMLTLATGDDDQYALML